MNFFPVPWSKQNVWFDETSAAATIGGIDEVDSRAELTEESTTM
ncbi:hypothetical protein L479_00934 [Exiguobacterium sp. S17]|nr:hypothetical protein L479_00934 [Exiguobacterium sp. S17]